MLKQVTIECDVPDGYEAVRFGVPRKGELFAETSNDMVHTAKENFHVTRLIVRPIPPALVPLGPEDVIPGKTLISREKWSIDRNGNRECCVIEYRGMSSFRIRMSYGPLELTFSDAMNDIGDKNRWLYSNDHGATWQPCSKPAN